MKRKLTALAIGNAKYPSPGALKNPANDAQDFAKALEVCGFEVELVIDASITDMKSALKAFESELAKNNLGLFYFAGHGMQVEGENYLAALDTDFDSEIYATHSSLALNQVIEVMEASGSGTNIIILDACRNNPFTRAWSRSLDSRGWAPVYAPKGTLVAFATSPGELASDGAGRNGAYTAALLKHIHSPDLPIEELFKRARNTLASSTKGKQTSWEHTSLSGDFYFNLGTGKTIAKYSQDAIADRYFVISKRDPSHNVIAKLRSYDWYTQNPAIQEIDDKLLDNADPNALFVLGRNIYQAAAGGSRSAIAFVQSFQTKTADTSADARINLLSGMLFEIFFDPEGEIRKDFKTQYFNEVFELQRYKENAKAFEFIADCLAAHPSRFYVIPGRGKTASVDVKTVPSGSGSYNVAGVYFAGVDILQEEEDDAVYSRKGRYRPVSEADLKALISEEMVIPLHLLKLTTDVSSSTDKFQFPYDYTMVKRT